VTGVTARGQLLAERAAARYSALPSRGKEVAQDSALALTLAVLNLMSLLPYQSQMHPAGLALFLVSVQCLPLAIRRLWPVPASILCGIPRSLYDSLGFGFAPLPLAPAIAFATIAERSRWWIRWPSVCFYAVGIIYGQRTPGHSDEPYDAIVQVFIFGAAWGIGMLSRARRDSMAAAARRAERAEAELDDAAARAAAAERLRIARELHDVVAHHVSLIAVQAEAVGALLPSRPVEAARSADLIAATARQAMTELRRLLGVLRFTSSDPLHQDQDQDQDQHQSSEERAELTPVPSITRLDEVLAFVRRAGLPVDSDVRGSPTALSPGVDLTAYRIVQEALTNALRHAPGSTARVNVAYEADCVTVRITDTGAGGGSAARAGSGAGAGSAAGGGSAARAGSGALVGSAGRADSASRGNGLLSHGYGLAGIAERVASCGGTLTLGPIPSGGFAVTARLPLT
jgi:signal transduction histidine kinase